MENASYRICLLLNVECYALETLLEVYLKKETNKTYPKQIKQQENYKPACFVLSFKYFGLL